MTTTPLLSIGTFGTHLRETPAKTFSFAGTVPNVLKDSSFKTYKEGFDAFVAWFSSCDAEFKRSNVGNLRDDAFESVFTF